MAESFGSWPSDLLLNWMNNPGQKGSTLRCGPPAEEEPRPPPVVLVEGADHVGPNAERGARPLFPLLKGREDRRGQTTLGVRDGESNRRSSCWHS